MWKLVLGFIVFAAVALFTIMKGGDVDMGGEKHGIDHAPAPAASAPASDAAPAAAPASAPASAASGA